MKGDRDGLATYDAVDDHGNGKDEIKDEKPAPRRHASPALHAGEQGGLEIAAEHLAEHAADDEQAAAAGQFALPVPCAEDVHDAGPGGRLEQADEEAEDVELVGAVALVQEKHEQGPDEEASGQPEPRRHDGENHVGECSSHNGAWEAVRMLR